MGVELEVADLLLTLNRAEARVQRLIDILAQEVCRTIGHQKVSTTDVKAVEDKWNVIVDRFREVGTPHRRSMSSRGTVVEDGGR